jgi:hypothetical protein
MRGPGVQRADHGEHRSHRRASRAHGRPAPVLPHAQPGLLGGGRRPIGVLTLVLLAPPIRGLFQLGPLHLDDLALSAGLTVALVLGLVLAATGVHLASARASRNAVAR